MELEDLKLESTVTTPLADRQIDVSDYGICFDVHTLWTMGTEASETKLAFKTKTEVSIPIEILRKLLDKAESCSRMTA